MPEFADHYSSIAAHYRAVRPRYPAALYDFLAGLLGSARPPVVWDACTGNGQVAVALAERGARVIATDASAAQIAAAVPHRRVDYRVELAEEATIAAGEVDLVAVAAGLHWLDHPRFFTQVRRVLRPGGVVAVWTYGTSLGAGPSLDAQVSAVVQELGPWWPPEVDAVRDGYQAVELPWADGGDRVFMLEEAWGRERVLGLVKSWSAARIRARHEGRELSPQVEQALMEAWGPHPRPVRLPVTLRWCRRPGR